MLKKSITLLSFVILPLYAMDGQSASAASTALAPAATTPISLSKPLLTSKQAHAILSGTTKIHARKYARQTTVGNARKAVMAKFGPLKNARIAYKPEDAAETVSLPPRKTGRTLEPTLLLAQTFGVTPEQRTDLKAFTSVTISLNINDLKAAESTIDKLLATDNYFDSAQSNK